MPDGVNQISPTESLDMASALDSVARAQPNADAILAPGRAPLSYGALLKQMADVREALNSWGIGRGDRVVVVLPDGPEAAVAFVSITACSVYTSLNRDYTRNEFEAYLKQLRPQAIVLAGNEETPARVVARELGISIIDLMVEDGAPAGGFVLTGGTHAHCSAPGPSHADDLALLTLTSGTTTQAKIVPVLHRHWMIAAWARVERLRINPQDCALSVMPLFHGHGQFLVLSALLGGASLVCLPRFDLLSFFKSLQRYPVTFYSASFAIHEAIASQIANYKDVVDHTNLRFFKVGSGRLNREVLDRLEEAFRAPAIELYSNSEVCVITANPLPPAIRKPGTAGFPVCGDVAILGDDGNFLPTGETGEIVARGPCLFEGYIDDPVVNETAFHEGWFRTGDLGCLDEDGFLTITGRLKEVINRGGEKITPLEVDQALQEHPAVHTAATFGFPHPLFGQEVAAAVILNDGVSADEEELIRFVRASLAHFKVPHRIFFVDDLPRTATEKIQRNSLSGIFASQLQQIENPTADPDVAVTRTPLETALTAVWKSVLQLDEIAPDDDFFLLGGDSLMAATLFAEVSAAFGVEIPLKAIFDDAATIEGMACIIENTRNGCGNHAAYSPKSSDVVVMNAGTSSATDLPPLFAVGGTGGHAIGFAHVARLLGPNQPFFGLDSVGLDGAQEPLTRMDHIAAEHIRRLRTVQPGGPYYLIGACFGGRVVHEMAQQLKRDGQAVGLTLLLDPSPPHRGREERDPLSEQMPESLSRARATRLFLHDRLKLYWSEFKDLPSAERLRYVGDKLKIVRDIGMTGDLHRGNATQLYRDAVFRANKLAGRSYTAAPYHGPVAVFWSQDREAGSVHRRYHNDWLALLGNKLMVADLPGSDSGNMLLPPNVDAVVENVSLSLRLAQGRSAH